MSDLGLDLASVTRRLAQAGCIAADGEAGELLAAAPSEAVLLDWIWRRERGEPLAWITGSIAFCGHRIRVEPGVYVPRWHSEELARRASARLPADGSAADLCTGTGAVAVHLRSEAPAVTVVGTDADPRAVRCARRNGVLAVVGDLGGPLRSGCFDVVTAVAPYVPTAAIGLLAADVQRYEPPMALDGGPDGLDLVRRSARSAARLLRPGGWFLTEIGAGQADPLIGELRSLGFARFTPWSDADGDLRGIAAQSSATDHPQRS